MSTQTQDHTNAKGLLTYLGVAFDTYFAERQRQSSTIHAPSTQNISYKSIRWWLPTPGNVIFTLFVISGLLWAQSAGAISLRALSTSTSIGTIAYQGRLANASGQPLTQTVNMIFRLYAAASGGSLLWEEQWTGSNSVQVSDGLFNVMLGSLTPMPQNVITGNTNLFLGITVGTDSEMSPRVQLGSVPFAIQALTVPDGSITAAKLADGAITQSKASGFVVTQAANLFVQYGFRTAVTGTTMTIPFAKPFAQTPTVVATADTVGGQSVTVSYITPSEFVINIPNISGNVAINWIAIGPVN